MENINVKHEKYECKMSMSLLLPLYYFFDLNCLVKGGKTKNKKQKKKPQKTNNNKQMTVIFFLRLRQANNILLHVI